MATNKGMCTVVWTVTIRLRWEVCWPRPAAQVVASRMGAFEIGLADVAVSPGDAEHDFEAGGVE